MVAAQHKSQDFPHVPAILEQGCSHALVPGVSRLLECLQISTCLQVEAE